MRVDGDFFSQIHAQATSAAPGGNVFSQIHAEKQTNEAQDQSLLSRAWKWAAETPILDNVLPKGVTTKDIVRGAAFENLFGEPYIPGTNDFDTKAQLHLGDSPTKAAVKTFLAGSARDTADMGTGMTTPVGLAATALGAGAARRAGQALISAGMAGKGAYALKPYFKRGALYTASFIGQVPASAPPFGKCALRPSASSPSTSSQM
jgi:hypothetical protein